MIVMGGVVDYTFYVCFFFFFQAEDGIRDDLVTGVQTCALPICVPLLDRAAVEDIVRRVEAIPEQDWRNFWNPLAEARERQGLSNTVDFLDELTRRKNLFRQRVNQAYNEIGQNSISSTKTQAFEVKRWGTYNVPGSTIPVNAPMAVNRISRELLEPPFPEGVPVGSWKAGVIIIEPDGRVWVAEPYGHFGDRLGTFGQGHVELGEMPAQAAAREATEEMGFSVFVREYLGDYPSDTGTGYMRYYLAERTGGGPAFVSDNPSL